MHKLALSHCLFIIKWSCGGINIIRVNFGSSYPAGIYFEWHRFSVGMPHLSKSKFHEFYNPCCGSVVVLARVPNYFVHVCFFKIQGLCLQGQSIPKVIYIFKDFALLKASPTPQNVGIRHGSCNPTWSKLQLVRLGSAYSGFIWIKLGSSLASGQALMEPTINPPVISWVALVQSCM